jgi:hypothetical protein
MDPIDLSSSRVNLNGPGDWKQWISIIHKFATAQNVWEYIDPSNAEKPALSKPEEPTVQQIRPTASDLTDLTAEEFRRLEFLHTQYRTKVQTHRDQQKALSSIQQHIVKTIGNYYSTIADEHDIAKELALLKARVQPTDWAHEQEVLERYYAVLKAPNRSKIDTWITSWQRILTEAQKLDLPDIKNLRPTRQFLQAVSSIDPAFTDYWINKMEDEARNKPNWQDSFPDGIKISEIFERLHKAKRATGSKAVFSTFQDEGPNQSNNGYNDGDKGSNRRSKPSCLCGKKHYYSECYYLSKAARPNGWKPNKDIEHKINQKLEDPVLKEKVNRSLERYAGQRPQEPQTVQDHQNSADVRGTAFAGRHVTQEAQRSTFATSVYPLKDSFILDSGSDTHICNNKDRFVSYEPLTIEEVAYAGDSQLSILGYGQVHLRLEEGGIFILNEVAHIPAFHTNVASLDRMINKGYNWNPQTGAVTAKGKIVFHTKRINRQPVIEFNQIRPQQAPSAFSSSSEPRPEQVQEATRWHQRLGHLNPEALEQLVRHTTGARIKGPIRIDCRPCSEAKATRIISQRRPARKLLENEAQKKAGFHIYTRSFFQGREEKLHRRSLPPEPRNWKELQGHRFEPEFKEAANIEMGSHWSRGTFKPIPTDEAQGRPLPLTWVFKYKFNKHGFLTRFKARLCVRGDLQQPNDKETYAATLAGRTFRVLMAITAKFDLETRQLDAVNAFTNSLIDEDIYVQFPDGYSRRGWILKLIRALYGLRRSPLLWQKDLSNTFKQLGLELCPEDPCVFNNTWLTAFFFVDDIVFLYRSRHQQAADRLIAQLRAKYKMSDLGSLQWFLGIRVIRDRPNGKLWLCQDSYIEKLTTQFSIKKSNTFRGNPLSTNNLQQYELQATTNEISMFQQKIGGINYIAVITRPDVAKAASKLAEFLANPSPQHQTIADKVISYLYATRHLAIQFGGISPNPTTGPIQVEHSSDLKIASDAAFADDQKTRKSSQGSIICLFGGPVSWKAGKQDTVTTSSTEAELLAFTHTAKESIAIQRLFKQLDLKLDHLPTIECDNQQTIRLISLETPRLKTALKHVDIHNCWARQAFKQGHFKIQYTQTALMLADGLTKPLPGQKFDQFVKQLGLIDISPLIEEAQVDSDLED